MAMCCSITSRMGSDIVKVGMVNIPVARAGSGLLPAGSKTDLEFGFELNLMADGIYDKLVSTA